MQQPLYPTTVVQPLGQGASGEIMNWHNKWFHMKYYHEVPMIEQTFLLPFGFLPVNTSHSHVPTKNIYGQLQAEIGFEVSPTVSNSYQFQFLLVNKLVNKTVENLPCSGWFFDRCVIRIQLLGAIGITKRFNLSPTFKEPPYHRQGNCIIKEQIPLSRFCHPSLLSFQDYANLQSEASSSGRPGTSKPDHRRIQSIRIQVDIMVRMQLYSFVQTDWHLVEVHAPWTSGYLQQGFGGGIQQQDFCSSVLSQLQIEKHRVEGFRFGSNDADIQFLVGAKSDIIGAHRFVLASKSPVLQKMLFDSNMTESSQGIISLPDDSYSAVKNFLTLLYNNIPFPEMMDMSVEEILEVLALAHKYQVDHVLEFSLWILLSYPDYSLFLHQIMEMFHAAKLYEIPDILCRIKMWFQWRSRSADGTQEIKNAMMEVDPAYARDVLVTAFL